MKDIAHELRSTVDIIERMPEEAKSSLCNIGRDEPATLEFVVRDYLRLRRGTQPNPQAKLIPLNFAPAASGSRSPDSVGCLARGSIS